MKKFLLIFLCLFGGGGCTFETIGEPEELFYDRDDDEIPFEEDNCYFISNPDQKDTDNDSFGDACDSCPFIFNPDPEDQANWKNCEDESDNDIDGDCVGDHCDNCRYYFNPDQKDTNNDSVGDACAE